MPPSFAFAQPRGQSIYTRQLLNGCFCPEVNAQGKARGRPIAELRNARSRRSLQRAAPLISDPTVKCYSSTALEAGQLALMAPCAARCCRASQPSWLMTLPTAMSPGRPSKETLTEFHNGQLRRVKTIFGPRHGQSHTARSFKQCGQGSANDCTETHAAFI